MTEPNNDQPAAPQNAAEASVRLDALLKDEQWTAAMLAGNGPQLEEFHKLSAMKAGATDTLDNIIAGKVETPVFETLRNGEMSTSTKISAVEWLRGAGLDDATVRQAFTGEAVSRGERDVAERAKADRMSNDEWVRAYLKGGAEQKREMTLLNLILSSPIKEAA